MSGKEWDEMKIYGNTDVVSALHQMVVSGRIPHAMMLHEDDGGGAFPLILHFLEELYGGNPRVGKLIHPDIHFVFPVAGEKNPVSLQFIAPFRDLLLGNPYFTENELYEAIGIEKKQSSISVAEARSILSALSLSAVEGGYRTVVMYLPEKMNAASGNALLKMVEEPPEKTLFLLVTHAPESVLTTIASRCLHLRVEPLSRQAKAEVRPAEAASVEGDLFADLLRALVEKDLLTALETGEAIAVLSSREKQKALCRSAVGMLRNIFLFQQGQQALADILPDEKEFYGEMAARCRRTFPRFAMTYFDRAQLLVERNVNQKIVFTDLVLKLYAAI